MVHAILEILEIRDMGDHCSPEVKTKVTAYININVSVLELFS